jgi:hypothetical protein
MSFNLSDQAFQPLLNSTAGPSFNSSALGSTSHAYALEATGRTFQYPDSRSVRLMASTADRFYVRFGDSSVAAASSNSMLVRNGDIAQIFTVTPNQTHVAFASSTTITINVTLGVGR